ncbi:hypothetical protein [Aeromonas veronii]|uniref:hypothetical protein n=1 Tax=Aeromonas veronii TaxID=654 RepID=UPI002B45C78A|nr:hypothetical protein [Aeromonas veronii]
MDMAELERIFFSRLNSMTDGEIIELVEKAEPCGLINSSAEAYAHNAINNNSHRKRAQPKSSVDLGSFIASEKLFFSNELLPQRNHFTVNSKRFFKSPNLSFNNVFDTASMDAVVIAA